MWVGNPSCSRAGLRGGWGAGRRGRSRGNTRLACEVKGGPTQDALSARGTDAERSLSVLRANEKINRKNTISRNPSRPEVDLSYGFTPISVSLDHVVSIFQHRGIFYLRLA